MIDSHCHLDHEPLYKNILKVIARAKKAGYKNPQDYTNVVARYGSEDNYKKGRGLGT